MNQELFHTTNIKVVAILDELGFERNDPFIERMKYEDGRETCTFWYRNLHADGTKAMDVFKAVTKDSISFQADNHDHPIALMHRVLLKRDEVIGQMKGTPRKLVIQKGNRFMAIPENASKETREKFIKQMNQ